MASRSDFFNLYRHGFARVALATPLVRIGDPMANAAATFALMQQAAKKNAGANAEASADTRNAEFKVAKESNSGVFLRSGDIKNVLKALEIAPHFRPAQNLLLELRGESPP